MSEKTIIPKGTILYRFIGLEPNKVKYGMTQNKGKKGRFNLYQNVYYCCKNIKSIKQEIHEKICGTLIKLRVKEDLILGLPENNIEHALLKGYRKDDKLRDIHKDFLFKEFGTFFVDDKITSNLFEKKVRITPDGINYPSFNSFDFMIGGFVFHIDDDLLCANYALTNQGYNKLEEVDKKMFFIE